MRHYQFPDPNLADNDGFIASGGDLSIDCLVSAYRQGIFPWFNEGDPYLWWCPNPRTVLFPKNIHISKSLRKRMKKPDVNVTFNHCFERVIDACSQPRRDDPITLSSEINDNSHTWITDEMKQAYTRLHHAGYAMSVETWYDKELVGGLYGVFIGHLFFGESMFSHQSDASKIALVTLANTYSEEIKMIDCQMKTDHIMRMGAELISRSTFLSYLKQWL